MTPCPHVPAPGTGRTKAQNAAFHGMKAKLGHERSYEIVREVTGGDDHSCTTTKEQMHEILNRMRLALGESPARYNRELRRRMVRPQRVPRGMPRVMTASQAEYIEDLVRKIGFGQRQFESWCGHYCQGKPRPETSAEATRVIEALKAMALNVWRPSQREDDRRDAGPTTPGEIIPFHQPNDRQDAGPTDAGPTDDIEVPF